MLFVISMAISGSINFAIAVIDDDSGLPNEENFGRCKKREL